MEEKSRGRSPGAPGSEVPVTVFRDGERVDVTLTLSERGAAAQSEETDIGTAADGELMGITISPVPELVRRNLGLQEGEAIMVQNVQHGSPAAEADLMQGDVILSADGDDINDAAALAQAWTTARAPVVCRADAPHCPNRLPASALDALSV